MKSNFFFFLYCIFYYGIGNVEIRIGNFEIGKGNFFKFNGFYNGNSVTTKGLGRKHYVTP